MKDASRNPTFDRSLCRVFGGGHGQAHGSGVSGLALGWLPRFPRISQAAFQEHMVPSWWLRSWTISYQIDAFDTISIGLTCSWYWRLCQWCAAKTQKMGVDYVSLLQGCTIVVWNYKGSADDAWNKDNWRRAAIIRGTKESSNHLREGVWKWTSISARFWTSLSARKWTSWFVRAYISWQVQHFDSLS